MSRIRHLIVWLAYQAGVAQHETSWPVHAEITYR